MSAVRVLIADHGLMRLSVRMALEGEADICAEAEDGEQAVLLAKREQPDVCIIGWDIDGEGTKAIQGILAVAPRTALIVLSEKSDVDDLLAAVRAGAVGYLPGNLDAEQLRRVVRGVFAHEAAVPRAMVRELILELRTATALGGVTDREAQVLGMLRRGHSTAEIASRLQISPVTVRRYISDLVRKLGVRSRAELMNLEFGADRPRANGKSTLGTGSANGLGGGDFHSAIDLDATDGLDSIAGRAVSGIDQARPVRTA